MAEPRDPALGAASPAAAGAPSGRLDALGTAVVLLTAAGILLIHLRSFAGMAAIWLRSDTFAHGLLIAPLAAYLIWRRRAQLARVAVRPNLLGLGVLLALSAAWLLAAVVEVDVVQHLAVVLMLIALSWTLLGTEFVRIITFPLLYLLFAVPLGEALVPPLMDFTAHFTVAAVKLCGIPVYREGFYISLPSGDFEVAKACSGIRYLIASLALGSLYAYLTYHSYWRRAVFIGLAVIVPIVANGLRAFGIVLIAHLSDMKIAVGVDHLVYGWVFFGLIMFLMFWLGTYFRDTAPQVESPDGAAALEPPVRGGSHAGVIWTAVAALVIVGAGPLGARMLSPPAVAELGYDPILPPAVSPWGGPTVPATGWRPRFPAAASELKGLYRRGADGVQLYAAHYRVRQAGGELGSTGNHIYEPEDFIRISASRRVVELPSGRRLELLATGVRSPLERLLIWHWYVIGTETTTSLLEAKLIEARTALGGEPAVAAVVAVATRLEDRPAAAEALLLDFLRSHEAVLDACLFGAVEPAQACSP